MKRILSVSICLLLLFSLAISASATGVKVTFTIDSLPEVGGTLTVDKNALMDNDSITAEMYNALLEGNVIYSWYKNGVVTKEGISADALSHQLTVSDQGCTFYVKVSFYEDDSFQEAKKCGEALSAEIVVTGPTPEIITESLANATVGTAYYTKLECSDPDAVFSEFMGSQLSEFGLCLTQHGEIEGIPTKTGNCHINILVVSEGGGENSVSFDLTVNTAPTDTESDPTTPTSDTTRPPVLDPTEPTQPLASDPVEETTSIQTTAGVDNSGGQDSEQDFPWIYVVIALGGIGAGIGITLVLVKIKKKA